MISRCKQQVRQVR